MQSASLCICRPFHPNSVTNSLKCNYYFVHPDYLDVVSILEVSSAYGEIYIEKSLYNMIGKDLSSIQYKMTVIGDLTVLHNENHDALRVAFLASSDTHVHFMLNFSQSFDRHIFIIPDKSCKDEAAANVLEKHGEDYIEIHYQANACPKLMEFQPSLVFCATDWTSEYNALRRILRTTGIPIIAIQEGPEDWHFRIWQNKRLLVSNHYRNADVLFANGAKTMNYIRPKIFAVTGNPKVSSVHWAKFPAKPKILINCNFTYVDHKPPYESMRDIWMKSVLRVCKKIGVDYFISKHPRDFSEWPGEPVINSNAFLVREQMAQCSICISRFSSIIYEALSYGRQAVYFNVHLEPMPVFQDETAAPVQCAISEEELENILLKHVSSYPNYINKDVVKNYLTRHMSKMDGWVDKRIISMLQAIGTAPLGNINPLQEKLETIKYKYDVPESKKLLEQGKNIVLCFYYENISDSAYRKWIDFAELLSEQQWKVFIILFRYDDYFTSKRYLLFHQCIEVILTRDYMIDLCNIPLDYLIVFKPLKNTKYAEGIQKLLIEAKHYVWIEDIDSLENWRCK